MRICLAQQEKFLKNKDMMLKTLGTMGFVEPQMKRFTNLRKKKKAVILTGDRDFGNILRFPLGDHFGIVVAHFPNEMQTMEINRYLLE
jgi:hypothetical protein